MFDRINSNEVSQTLLCLIQFNHLNLFEKKNDVKSGQSIAVTKCYTELILQCYLQLNFDQNSILLRKTSLLHDKTRDFRILQQNSPHLLLLKVTAQITSVKKR